MSKTLIGVNDPKAVKRYSGLLAYDVSQKSYFNQKLMGRGADCEVPIQIITNLRFDWHEETRDDGDKVVITSSSILGTKKVSFPTAIGMQDFGVIALDTAAAVR